MEEIEFERIDVPLNWVEIDSIIVALRMVCKAGLAGNRTIKILEYLEPFSMKAKANK